MVRFLRTVHRRTVGCLVIVRDSKRDCLVIARDSERDCLDNRTICYLTDSDSINIERSYRRYAKVYYYSPTQGQVDFVSHGRMDEDDSCYINRIYHRGVSESANQHETVTTTIQTGITEKCTSS